jgi:UDP:flavonoid glycosyltransferase YjiC (YdhE family)
MKIAMLTFGSRGDVQPYVALAKGLKNDGHSVVVMADSSFNDLIIGHGLNFSPVGDYAISMKQKMGQWLESRSEAYKALQFFLWVKPLLPTLLNECWKSCQHVDAIISGPMALGGSHIAEKLGIPHVLAIVGPPLTPTIDFSSSYLPFSIPFGKYFNRLTHVIAMQSIWLPFRSQINRWRKYVLGLPPLGLSYNHDQIRPIQQAVLYGYSPILIPPASDWSKNVHVTGYWFSCHDENWKASQELLAFLKNGPPPICIGFGSMVPERSDNLTSLMIEALEKTGQRGIFLSGWRDMSRRKMPGHFLTIPFAPHEWLFSKVAGIIHHGGAGTTAAALRSGTPSGVVYFWKEQLYWGQKLFHMGVGAVPISYKKLTVGRIADMINELIRNPDIRKKAGLLGQQIRKEDGIAEAVRIINHHIIQPN